MKYESKIASELVDNKVVAGSINIDGEDVDIASYNPLLLVKDFNSKDFSINKPKSGYCNALQRSFPVRQAPEVCVFFQKRMGVDVCQMRFFDERDKNHCSQVCVSRPPA